jgi:type II secretory pathway pseudopilin PulG
MRQRIGGFTLLEVLIVATLLTIVVLVSFSLLGTGTDVMQVSTVRQLTELQARKVLDEMCDDFGHSAAWCYWQVTGNPAGTTPTSGSPVTRLTAFWGAPKFKTRGATNDTTAFSFGPLDASTDAVAFLRQSAAYAYDPPGTTAPSYLILDFEPKESTALAADINNNGDAPLATRSVSNNQPGRMDDDPNRMYIMYRTRVFGGRVIVERYRGISGMADGSSSTPQQIQQIGDLGPDLGAGTRGFVTVSAIDCGTGNGGAGMIEIRVVAKGTVKGRDSNSPTRRFAIITTDLNSRVTPICSVPPQ